MGVARLFTVNPGATQFFHRNFFTQHGFDHFGTGNEHLGDVFHHEHEVGQRRRIDRTPGAGTQDHRDLRDHTAGEGVAEKDFAVTGQGVHSFLDTGTARVVDPDQRNAHIERVVHDLGDLAGVHKAQRATGHGEVLGEDGDRRTADRTRTDDHTVAGKRFVLHAEVTAVVLDEQVVFVERIGVQQRDDTLTGRQLTHGLLLLDGLFTATDSDLFFALLKLKNLLIFN